MKKSFPLKWVLLTLVIVGWVFTGSAFAASKDELYVTSVSSVNVGGSPVTFSDSLNPANIRTVGITNAIVGAQTVSITVTWGIAAGTSLPRTTTWPNDGVTFSGSSTSTTNTPPSPDVGAIGVSPATCDFSDETKTGSTTVTFTTPNATFSPFEVQISPNPPSKSPAIKELQPRNLKINFSVIAQVAKDDTTLTVSDPQCFQYKAGDISLTAILTETVSTNPIARREIDFSVDSSFIGSALTGNDGKAELTYNVDGLSAADHDLYAAFAGDANYNPSSGSATLGIYYNFVGFQPPINPQGNSIFGNGRVIPVKIKIVDANLNPVSDAQPTVWVYQWSPSTGLGDVIEAATSVSSADTENIMRYVPDDEQYIYNWDLSNLSNGTYAVVVELGDSKACGKGPYYATITVERKGGKK